MEVMNYTLTRADSVAAFDASDWNSLANDSTFMMSHGWLMASERIRNIQPEYLVVMSGQRIVGALPCYTDVNRAHTRYQPAFVLAAMPACGNRSWIIGGSPAGYESSVLLAAYIPEEDRVGVLRMLLAAAAELCASADAPGVALGYLSPRDLDLLRTVHTAWTGLEGPANAVIDLPAGGFDEYQSMLSTSRRAMVRREMRAFDAAGYACRIGRLSEGIASAAKLLAQLEEKYGNAVSVDVVRDSLQRQASTLDDRSFLVTCDRDGSTVGFCLLYYWRETLYARSAGFDYERLANAFEYFNLVVYRSVQLAYRLGCDRLHLGMGSYEAKTARGAGLRRTWWMLLDAKGYPYVGMSETENKEE
jgi:uncharacterized protein